MILLINSNPNVTIYVSLSLVRETLVIAATFFRSLVCFQLSKYFELTHQLTHYLYKELSDLPLKKVLFKKSSNDSVVNNNVWQLWRFMETGVSKS